MKKTFGAVAIFPRNDGFIDVFTGDGWEKHTVFQLVRGHPMLVRGVPLTEKDFRMLKDLV